MKLLQCYSKGDKRYSALCARLKSGHTIEFCYQNAKRDANQKPFAHPQWNPGFGMNPTYLYLNREMVPSTRELQWQFYTMLWSIYFEENHNLFYEALKYDGFYEKPGSPIYHPNVGMKLPYHLRIDQAASIAFVVWTAGNYCHNDIIDRSYKRYESIYPLIHTIQ